MKSSSSMKSSNDLKVRKFVQSLTTIYSKLLFNFRFPFVSFTVMRGRTQSYVLLYQNNVPSNGNRTLNDKCPITPR